MALISLLNNRRRFDERRFELRQHRFLCLGCVFEAVLQVRNSSIAHRIVLKLPCRLSEDFSCSTSGPTANRRLSYTRRRIHSRSLFSRKAALQSARTNAGSCDPPAAKRRPRHLRSYYRQKPPSEAGRATHALRAITPTHCRRQRSRLKKEEASPVKTGLPFRSRKGWGLGA